MRLSDRKPPVETGGSPAEGSFVRIARSAPIALAGVFTCLALAFAAFSFIPYRTAYDWLLRFYNPDTVRNYLTVAAFETTVFRVRLMAGAALIAAAACWAARRRISNAVDWLLRPLWLDIRHARQRRSGTSWFSTPEFVAMLLLFALALALRIVYAGVSMRYDEAVTFLNYARQPAVLAVSLYNEPNNHLLHSLLVHWSVAIFGADPWAIRLPAILAGAALPALTYLLSRQFWGHFEAAAAGVLLACSSIWIEYSVNARGYGMIACAFVALLLCLMHASKRASPAWLAAAALVCIAGLYTNPAFLMGAASAAVWAAAISLPMRRTRLRVTLTRAAVTAVAAGVCVAVLYAPAMVVSGANKVAANPWVQPKPWSQFVTGNRFELMKLSELFHREMPEIAVWIGLGLALAGLALNAPRRFRLLALACVATCVLFLAARRFVPFARVWLFATPLYAMAVGAGLGLLFKPLPAGTLRTWATPVLAALLAAFHGAATLRSDGIEQSTETGALRAAPDIVADWRSRGIAPSSVRMTQTSEYPLRYYWWRATGQMAVRARGDAAVWCLVNTQMGEVPERICGGQAMAAEREFNGAALYRFSGK